MRCYRYTMLHDIRPTGDLWTWGKPLLFHSKIILPKVYFPSVHFFFSSRIWRTQPPNSSLHTSGEAPGNECASHLQDLWKVCGGGALSSMLLFLPIFARKKGVTGATDLTACENEEELVIVSLILTHFTHTNRASWVEEIRLPSHTWDQCIRGWSFAAAKAGP